MISRRGFLRILGLNLAALAIPAPLSLEALAKSPGESWPRIRLASLPDFAAEVLSLVPRFKMNQAGYLLDLEARGGVRTVWQRQTEWNRLKSADYDCLLTRYPWVIVVHWFGNTEDHSDTLDSFMRGFDGLRTLDGREQRTSAHFLVGRYAPSQATDETVSVVQTQKPGPDGIPYLASHLHYVNSATLKNRTYFIRALDELSIVNPGVYSSLQDINARPQIDPNYYSLAIEMDGYNFDTPGHMPPAQQFANLLGLLWALMERYQIPASAVLGHDEIDLRKGDPGKKFMATVRYLLGLKALVEGDPMMCELVFGQYLAGSSSFVGSVSKYFEFIREYLVRISIPKQVFEWESETKYWTVADQLAGRSFKYSSRSGLVLPMGDLFVPRGHSYLHPEDHEGIDLYSNPDPNDYRRGVEQAVLLSFPGECLYTGLGYGCSMGPAAVFRHRTLTGSDYISIYGHMNGLGQVTSGKFYPAGHSLGSVRGTGFADDGYLHLAFAYGATWDADLKNRTSPPSKAPVSWLLDRYLSPEEVLVPSLG